MMGAKSVPALPKKYSTRRAASSSRYASATLSTDARLRIVWLLGSGGLGGLLYTSTPGAHLRHSPNPVAGAHAPGHGARDLPGDARHAGKPARPRGGGRQSPRPQATADPRGTLRAQQAAPRAVPDLRGQGRPRRLRHLLRLPVAHGPRDPGRDVPGLAAAGHDGAGPGDCRRAHARHPGRRLPEPRLGLRLGEPGHVRRRRAELRPCRLRHHHVLVRRPALPHGRLGLAAHLGAAHGHAGPRPAGYHRALHAGEHAGGHPRRLHAHRARQGPQRGPGDLQARAQERFHPRGDAAGADVRRGGDGLVLRGGDLPRPRHGPLLRALDDGPRLPDDHGGGAGLRRLPGCDESRGRPALRRARPEDPLLVAMAPTGEAPLRGTSLWQDALRRLRRNRLAMAGAVVVVLLCLVAIFADVLAPYPYTKTNFGRLNEAPSRDYPLGTDQLGRDLLSRMIYGARISMLVGLGAQVVIVLIGVPIGALSGYLGGRVDLFLTRLIDVMYAFPRLLGRHILPNALTPIVVLVAFGIPEAIFTEAALSFIGVGINPPTPSWGQMVGEGQQYLRSYWHLCVFPSIAIAVTMLSFTFLGDGVRDALDPKLK